MRQPGLARIHPLVWHPYVKTCGQTYWPVLASRQLYTAAVRRRVSPTDRCSRAR